MQVHMQVAMHVESVVEPGEEWDAFAQSMPGVTVGHAAAWARILEQAYGLAPHYLAARSPRGELVGILPLVRFRQPLRGSELISLPYLDSAGPLAAEPDVAQALRMAAIDLARGQGMAALELRETVTDVTPHDDDGGLDRVDLVLALEADVDAQWKALRAKVRNQTRKAEREGLEIADGTPDELLEGFYGPFAVNMRDLGSPVHARGFFAAAARHFGDRLRFVVTRLGDRPVGGLVAIHFGPVVAVPWASTLRSERSRCPNNQIYWEALRWAIERGACELDFGRSPRGSGTHRFKLGWGAEERALAWTRLAPDGRPLPIKLGREGGVLTRLSEVWTRLPVPLASWIGPRVRRYFSN